MLWQWTPQQQQLLKQSGMQPCGMQATNPMSANWLQAHPLDSLIQQQGPWGNCGAGWMAPNQLGGKQVNRGQQQLAQQQITQPGVQPGCAMVTPLHLNEQGRCAEVRLSTGTGSSK